MVNNNENIPLILIVDDNDSNLQVLAGLLMDENCEIAVARNGIEALDFIQMTPPHLVLLDIMMPELDGFETCRRLKNNPDTENIPVIFLSARIETEDIIKGFEAGAVDYITKPFNSYEVLARVKTQLKLRLSILNLEHMNKERKELLHILCHDLTNPIGFIKNSMILVNDGILEVEEIKYELFTAADNGLNVIELIRKLMALEGRLLELKNTGLSEAVGTSLIILKHKIDKKKMKVKVNINENISVLAEKVSLINSVILNLLTNSIKFSYHDSTIKISAVKKDTIVVLTIEDQGIGMPDKILQNIFSLTHTTSRPGTENEAGTGFGMPLVKKFIDIYGGSIKIESSDINENPKKSGTLVSITFKSA